MGSIKIPAAKREFEIADYIEGGEGTLVMKSPTPLLLAKADNHGSRFALDNGITKESGERGDRLISTEVMVFTLENILYDKATGELIGRDLLEQFPESLFNAIVEVMYETYDIPLTDGPGETTKKE